MTDARVRLLAVAPRSVRTCRCCGRAAVASVTLGNLGSSPDRCTFYCAEHDPTGRIEAVLAVLRAGLPDVCAVIRSVA